MKNQILHIFTILLFTNSLFAQLNETKPIKISQAVFYVKTKKVSQLHEAQSPLKEVSPLSLEVKNELNFNKWENTDKSARPGEVQDDMGDRPAMGPVLGFEGQGPTGYYPPDTDGDVSDSHFVQVVNSKYNVYTKDGQKILGPLNLSTLWDQLPGGPWGNDGDPIVLWDEEAGRWIITQFRVNSTIKYELFAVSTTSDPTGSFHLYAFSFGTTMNDYPKIGVWRDGYYATYNMFQNGSFTGARFTAVERDKMLIGDPDAQMIEFHKSGYYSAMPADIDGENLPDVGAPCPIMYITASQQVEIWNLSVDWDNPNSSSLIKQSSNISVSSFSEVPNTYNGSGGFIQQPATSQRLDGLGGMIMNRLAYRKFADHESMVVNHSILVQPNGGGSYDRAGVRWYEFRKTTGNWSLYQEGTYAPNDATNRWMGSAAMNANGDIAIAYSVSNGTDVYPSIRATGRFASDPLGEMTIEEMELKTGNSSQNSFGRWGDYSCLNVDPSDDETFWFTTEYNGWRTWIAAFDLGGANTPTANAGTNSSICQNQQFITNGSGDYVQDILWTTDGDGSFAPNNQFATTYIRGNQDIQNGGCTLTLTTTGFDGVSTATDDMYLEIIGNPTSDAGADAQIDASVNCQLHGVVENSNSVQWTTLGDGSFNSPGLLNAIYSPGANDISSGSVDLYLEAFAINPCSGSDVDVMTVNISSSEVSVLFDPMNSNVSTNEVFNIALEVVDIENLGSFEVELEFDPNLLQVNTVALGDLLGSTGRQVFPLENAINNNLGTINFAATTLGANPPGANGSGILLNLECLSTDNITVEEVTQMVINYMQITQPDGTLIPFTSQNANITISPCYIHDFDCDCDVDIVDVTMAAFAYGTEAGDVNYDAKYDLDNDGDIDIVDITMVTYDYGWSCDNGKKSTLNLEGDNTGVELSFKESVSANDVKEVEIYVENIHQLGAYELALAFDPQNVEVIGVESGHFLEEGNRETLELQNSIDSENGIIQYAIASLGSSENGAIGSGSLLKIKYQVRKDTYKPFEFIESQMARIDAKVIHHTYKFSPTNFNENMNTKSPIISVYPNPFDEKLGIYFKIQQKVQVSFKIFDVLGNTCFQSNEMEYEIGLYNEAFMLKHLNPGIYVLTVQIDGTQKESVKIIKN